jgi:hypothetical protein
MVDVMLLVLQPSEALCLILHWVQHWGHGCVSVLLWVCPEFRKDEMDASRGKRQPLLVYNTIKSKLNIPDMGFHHLF